MNSFFKLLTWACAVALVACKSDETGEPNLRFTTPSVTDVSVTTATVNFPSRIDPSVLASLRCGIAYGESDRSESEYTVVERPEVDGQTLRCRLTDLSSGTEYLAYAFVEWGSTRVVSEAIAFRTDRIGSLPVVEITSLQPVKVPSAGGDYTIAYRVHNPLEGEWAEASTTASWINSIDNTEPGEITFRVDANPDARERSATVTLTYTGAASVAVRIEQAARASEPETPQTVLTLTADDEWPSSYPSSETTCTLGGKRYKLKNVADFGNGIQFKRSAGYLANEEDMGAIRSIEVVYRPNSGNTDMTLLVGDEPVSGETELKAVKDENGTYVFDCTGYSYRYFMLRSGSGASYVQSIRITCGGQGGTTPPDPVREPEFGTPAFDEVTQNGAAIFCSYAYAGEGSVTAAYFLYNASGEAERRAALGNAQPGTKRTVLSGLNPATRYTFRLCIEIDGKTWTSGTGSFITLDEAGKPVVGVRYTGWAELPTEDPVKLNNEYFYAYHLCPDYPSSGRKARNFTTCYSRSYKCPVWVAAPLHDCYTGGVKRTNAYRTDPDIRCTQVGHWGGYTRGHMLGSNERRVTSAVNRDVFYYSNIGPQVQTYFNTGGGQWNTAEDWVDKQWRGLADTCYQVVGTYWENTSKVESGTTIPTHYYIVLLKARKSAGRKWVVNCSKNELQTIGILVRHKAYNKSEVVKADNFESRSIFKSVAEIERLTGHTFFVNVPDVPKETYNPADWNF